MFNLAWIQFKKNGSLWWWNLAGAFWALLEEDDQSSAFSCKAGVKAAFLEPKFDHKAALAAAEASGLEGAEARFSCVSLEWWGVWNFALYSALSLAWADKFLARQYESLISQEFLEAATSALKLLGWKSVVL